VAGVVPPPGGSRVLHHENPQKVEAPQVLNLSPLYTAV
jgi:hypothetical protein